MPTGPFFDHAIESKAVRDQGVLGRGGNMGNGIFSICYSDLPQEAKDTIERIASNGPFPYPQKDGTLFKNRFGDLPQLDYDANNPKYLEYTVPTPGVSNRGKRRILAHKNGVLLFTACHYERVQGNMSPSDRIDQTLAVDEAWRNGFYVITGLSCDLRVRICQSVKDRYAFALATS